MYSLILPLFLVFTSIMASPSKADPAPRLVDVKPSVADPTKPKLNEPILEPVQDLMGKMQC